MVAPLCGSCAVFGHPGAHDGPQGATWVAGLGTLGSGGLGYAFKGAERAMKGQLVAPKGRDVSRP